MDLDDLVDDELHPGQADAVGGQPPPAERGGGVRQVEHHPGSGLRYVVERHVTGSELGLAFVNEPRVALGTGYGHQLVVVESVGRTLAPASSLPAKRSCRRPGRRPRSRPRRTIARSGRHRCRVYLCCRALSITFPTGSPGPEGARCHGSRPETRMGEFLTIRVGTRDVAGSGCLHEGGLGADGVSGLPGAEGEPIFSASIFRSRFRSSTGYGFHI